MKDIVDRYNSARVEPAPKEMLDEAIAEVVMLRARIAVLEAIITAATVILSEFGLPSEDKIEDAYNVLTTAIVPPAPR